MAQAVDGDTVRVHYTGKLEDGTTFGSSADDEPVQFTIGRREVIPGFENAVIGMTPGEVKTAEVPADQAYGAYDDGKLVTVERSRLPSDFQPLLGQELEIQQPDGQVFPVRITEVSESGVTLDANHMLAGRHLTFDIHLLEIV